MVNLLKMKSRNATRSLSLESLPSVVSTLHISEYRSSVTNSDCRFPVTEEKNVIPFWVYIQFSPNMLVWQAWDCEEDLKLFLNEL